MIITFNLGFAGWTQVFWRTYPHRSSLLDRLTHIAHIINCDWESFRLQESLKSKGRTNQREIEGDQPWPVESSRHDSRTSSARWNAVWAFPVRPCAL